MTLSASPAARYPAVSRVLHWLVAAGIVMQYLLGERAEEAADAGELQLQLASLAVHKSIGITVLVFVFARILWRWLQPAPALPEHYVEAHPLLARLSSLAHYALYALLVFLPLSGWLMSSASAYSVSWFNLFTLPDLVGPDDSMKDWFQSTHHLAAKALVVLAAVHVAAALKHLLIDKTGVMGRMADASMMVLFSLTLASGVWLTWPTDSRAAAAPSPALPAETPQAPPDKTETTSPAKASSALKPWLIDYANSHIEFTATQAGAEFTGQWRAFSADIRFDEANLSQSSARVTIDALSVATEDSERDTTLAGTDWFDSAHFAEVVFTADAFSAQAPAPHAFTTKASLNIRGSEYPVEFHFSLASQGNTRTLTGTATLDRLALNLGTQEWTDTEWVGQFVKVAVKVTASVN